MIRHVFRYLFLALALIAAQPQAWSQQTFTSSLPDFSQFQMLDAARSQKTPDTADANDLTFRRQVLERQGVVLVEFMLPTCGECDPVLRIVQNMVPKFEGRVGYLRLDRDKNPGLGDRYDVARVPAILVFKDGKLIEKFAVFTPAQKELLAKTIEEQLRVSEQPKMKIPALAARDLRPLK